MPKSNHPSAARCHRCGQWGCMRHGAEEDWITVPVSVYYQLHVVAEAVRSLLTNEEIADDDWKHVATFALGNALIELDEEKNAYVD